MPAPTQPFCLFHRDGTTRLAVGEITLTRSLDDLPRPTAGTPVISMLPYAQVRERGFVAHDDGEPIISLVADRCEEVALADVIPASDPEFGLSEITFEMTDAEYADVVRRIVRDEICQGEGSNFLISRAGEAVIDGFSEDVARTVFGRLVGNEPEAYITFCFFDGEKYFIGSSPERHISFFGSTVTMNPICGTLPKRALTKRADLVEFLTDPKEIHELFQVVDEELKMMARICSAGGVVKGPYLKEMSSLIHTEYLLVGHSRMDKVTALRESMFAATMIGSPLENAARIIHKYEKTSRRYYSSAFVLHGFDDAGEEYLDSAITIRTMEVSAEGRALLRSGGSLVRDSDPEKETAEVQAKVAGLLNAIASPKRSERVLSRYVDPGVEQILASRNRNLSRFWTVDQAEKGEDVFPGSPSVLLVDNEDEFSHMLGHAMSRLGLDVTVRRWDAPEVDALDADLVLIGPGPGDPRDPDDAKMRRVRELVRTLLGDERKFVAVCLGHQMVCQEFGLEVRPFDPPLQGVQESIELFGVQETVGFYNTFFALDADGRPQDVELSAEADGRIMALRAKNFATFQFHVESVLTSNSLNILRQALAGLLS